MPAPGIEPKSRNLQQPLLREVQHDSYFDLREENTEFAQMSWLHRNQHVQIDQLFRIVFRAALLEKLV